MNLAVASATTDKAPLASSSSSSSSSSSDRIGGHGSRRHSAADIISIEVLGRIFQHLPLSPELLALRRVCKKWKGVLESDWLCMHLLGPCIDEIAWCKTLMERDGLREEYRDDDDLWAEKEVPCWLSGEVALYRNEGDRDSWRSVLAADDNELDDSEYSCAMSECWVEHDRWRWRCGKVSAVPTSHEDQGLNCCNSGAWFELLRDVVFAEHMYHIFGYIDRDPYHETTFVPVIFSNNPPHDMIRHFYQEHKNFNRSIFDVATNYIHYQRLPLRFTHFSCSDLDAYIEKKGGKVEPDRFTTFCCGPEGPSLEDIFDCDGIRALDALRKYCGQVLSSDHPEKSIAEPPLCVAEMPPSEGSLRNRDGTSREKEVFFGCVIRDVYLLSVSPRSGRIVGFYGRAMAK
ncbi:hypothetical protein HK405_013719 [Cladochytrium tenue]|nr:hypothetical protein HK405_013719 [Cladochytrium tenue]